MTVYVVRYKDDASVNVILASKRDAAAYVGKYADLYKVEPWRVSELDRDGTIVGTP